MFKNIVAAAAALTLLGSPAVAKMKTSTTTKTAQCRDTKGRFMKCASSSVTTAAGVTKDKNGRCHVASGSKKGQFTKCP